MKYQRKRETGEGNPHVLGMQGGDIARICFVQWRDALYFVQCSGGPLFYYSGEWYLHEVPDGVALHFTDDVAEYIA